MGCHLWISVTWRSGCPPGQEMRTLLHHNPALPPAMLPFIPVLLVVWGIFFFSLFWNKKIKGFLCGLMWGNNPTNDLPRGSLSSLPPRKEGAVWLSRTFGGLSAIPAHYLITSSPQALGLFFFFFFLAKPFLVQLGILFAACCSHGTTPPNNSGLSKQKWHLGLYDHHSAFVSIPER